MITCECENAISILIITGPISITLYMNIEDTVEVVRRILAIENILKRQNILLHVVPEHGVCIEDTGYV